ncbi:MAG: hypothetical protein K8T20_07255 [Planctomycetes bacterium]|nr:hypothetical protein [Planctomycetota bacterium]
MKRFALKSLLFCFPFAAVFGLPLLILRRSGELVAVNDVIQRQMGSSPVLYGQAYSNPVKAYKLRSVKRRDSAVVALGSSRTMQLREGFFVDPGQFYNAGGAVSAVWDFRNFLGLIGTRSRVKVLLLCLDQWFFNPARPVAWGTGLEEFLADDPALNIIQRNWLSVYRDLVSHKIDFRRLLIDGPRSDVGLNAVLHANGFRNDGSYFYGAAITNPDSPENLDRGFRDTLSRISSGTRRFEWSDVLAQKAIDEVDLLLGDCHDRGITVVGFLPPFAPTVRRAMVESGRYGYMSRIEPALRPSFDRYQFPLFDFTDPATLVATDSEFIDGFHGSERTYARLLLRLASGSPELERHINRTRLVEQLAHAGRFNVEIR